MTGRDRVVEACELGGSTIFGSGLNPGFIQLFAIVSAGLSDRVDRVSIVESFDTTIYNSPETEKIMGFGYPIDHPDLLAVTEEGSGIFREAVHAGRRRPRRRARRHSLRSRVRPDHRGCRPARRLGHRARAAWRESTSAGRGLSASRDVVEVRASGPRAKHWNPTWEMGFGYNITVEGRPTIKTTLAFEPPAGLRRPRRSRTTSCSV